MKPAHALFFTTAILLVAQSDDRNSDGVITRNEWRGDMREFRDRDINRDGVLSGTELRRSRRDSEMSRGTEPQRHREFSRYDQNADDVIERSEWRGDMATFRSHDVNRDGRISWAEYSGEAANQTGTRGRANELDKNSSGAVEGYEWPYNNQLFHRLDTNGDSVLTNNELNNLNQAALRDLDRNRNGRLDSDEWPGGFAQFRELDGNGDGRVTSNEYFDRGGNWQRRQRFQSWDKNGDGIIQSTEWQSERDLFHRLDTNGNSQVEWEEFRADRERYLTPRR